jgi:hypothetical protein
VIGHVRIRFSTHLPANTPVHPQRIQRKSLFRSTLPITALFPLLCAENNPIFNKTKIGGRGYPESPRKFLTPTCSITRGAMLRTL